MGVHNGFAFIGKSVQIFATAYCKCSVRDMFYSASKLRKPLI